MSAICWRVWQFPPFDLFNYLGLSILEFGFASPAALNFKKAVSIAGSDLIPEVADAVLT